MNLGASAGGVVLAEVAPELCAVPDGASQGATTGRCATWVNGMSCAFVIVGCFSAAGAKAGTSACCSTGACGAAVGGMSGTGARPAGGSTAATFGAADSGGARSDRGAAGAG